LQNKGCATVVELDNIDRLQQFENKAVERGHLKVNEKGTNGASEQRARGERANYELTASEETDS
jgi:hypothetical protein